MGWLYLPKTTPTAGQKGFMCGDVFVPIEGGTPSAYKKGICISNSYQKNESKMPSDGLVFHLPLEQDSATAETGQELSTKGTVTYKNLEGIRCAYFDGSSAIYTTDSISIPVGKNPSSISAFIAPIKGNPGWFISYGTASSYKSRQIGIIYNDTWQFGGWSMDYRSTQMDIGKWQHVVMTCDGTNFKFYKNGELIQTGISENVNTVFIRLVIGASPSLTEYAEFYISGARMYDRVLTDDEIKLLSTEWQFPSIGKAFIPLEEVQPEEGAEFEKNSEEMPSGGLILHVPLAQSATADELGNELSETGNVAFTTVEGIQCAQFDGDSYIQFIVDSEKALSGSSTKVPFTITLWAYAQKSENFSETRGVFQYSTNVPDDQNTIGAYIKTDDDGKLFGIIDITDGFHFIAVTRDSTGAEKCYLDGVLLETVSTGPLQFSNSHGYIGRIVYRKITGG